MQCVQKSVLPHSQLIISLPAHILQQLQVQLVQRQA